jgi:hypothetical protein
VHSGRFDSLTRSITTATSRRRLTQLVSGVALAGGFGTGDLAPTAAKKRCKGCRRCGNKCCPSGRACRGKSCVKPCSDSVCGQFPAACQFFPADNIWRAKVDELPVDDRSDDYVTSIGRDTGLHADFGSGLFQGKPIGIPFVAVPGDQPLAAVTFRFDEESDPGPYPIPIDAPIEGGPCGAGDSHVLIVDQDACILYELYKAKPLGSRRWKAGSGAIFDLNSNDLRTEGFTSADAAGLPILPGLALRDEVEAGVIAHALRFTCEQTQNDFVWPARHEASDDNNPKLPKMGQRFRLKEGFNIDGFSADNQVILTALKEYGMMLADNGSNWFLSGAPDPRWDNDDLRELQEGVLGKDFEAVDVSSLKVSEDSGQVQP